MLTTLTINNVVLIDHLTLEMQSGLCALTGETGAGKSILLGALGLIMGDRADTKSLYNESQKCVIEGNFNIRPYNLSSFSKRTPTLLPKYSEPLPALVYHPN